MDEKETKKLFWACFVALVATSFVFGLRANIIGDWQALTRSVSNS